MARDRAYPDLWRHRVTPRLLQLSGHWPGRSVCKALDVKRGCTTSPRSARKPARSPRSLLHLRGVNGPHTYDRFAKPHLSRAGRACNICGTRRKARWPPASLKPAGSGMPTPMRAHPDLQLHLGLGTGIEKGVEAMPAWRRDAQFLLSAAAIARHGPAGQSADPAKAPLIDPNYLRRCPQDQGKCRSGG